MKLELRPCPCGKCTKHVVHPLFGAIESALRKEDAEELIRRWNSFENEAIDVHTVYWFREFVEAEPELPGDMPPKLFEIMRTARAAGVGPASEFCREIVRDTKEGIVARLKRPDLPRPDWVRKRNQRLDRLLILTTEFCDAIDAEEEDVGGHRPSRTILGEIGPLVDKLNGRK